MAKRIFIEDIGKIIRNNENICVWKFDGINLGLPSKVYLVESEVGRDFLLKRGSCGRVKFELIQQIARKLFSTISKELEGFNSFRQFIILRGGYPFDLQDASGELLGDNLLPTTFLKLQRVLSHNSWKIQKKFLLGSWSGDVWFVPDTAIASGSTIDYLLKEGFRRQKPKLVILMTASGSKEGVQKIYRTCLQYNVNLLPVFSQVIFSVSPTGVLPNLPYSDLPILAQRTITTKKFYKKALLIYQGKKMCSIGDIGESLENPPTYLLETMKEISLLKINPNRQSWLWTRQLWRNHFFNHLFQESYPDAYKYFQEIFKGE